MVQAVYRTRCGSHESQNPMVVQVSSGLNWKMLLTFLGAQINQQVLQIHNTVIICACALLTKQCLAIVFAGIYCKTQCLLLSIRKVENVEIIDSKSSRGCQMLEAVTFRWSVDVELNDCIDQPPIPAVVPKAGRRGVYAVRERPRCVFRFQVVR